MLSHVIYEHMVLNIVLCEMSFSHEEIKDLPDKPFQPQHYSVMDEEMKYNTNFILHESIYKSDD